MSFLGGAVGCLGIRVSRGKVSMGSRVWGDMIWGGVLPYPQTTKAGGTYPTGMLSCCDYS